jgi:hypothetical protein
VLETRKDAEKFPLKIWWNSEYTIELMVSHTEARKSLQLYEQRKPYRDHRIGIQTAKLHNPEVNTR